MGKLIKFILYIIGFALVLLIGAAVAVVAFVDPNDFKPEITAQAKKLTGRELAIDGDLEFTFTPWLGIKTGALTLGNPAGFKQKTFAHIDAAEIRAKLVPLFSGEVEMDTVTLKGLELNLVQLRDGRNNWSDLGGNKASDKKDDKGSNGGKQLAALAVGGVDIEDANISWDDQKAGEKITLSKLNLQTGELQLGAPIAFSLDTHIKRKSDGLSGNVKADSTLRMNPFDGNYAADALNLAVNLKGKNLPGGSFDAALRADVVANLLKQTLSLSKLEVAALTLQANGNVSASNILKSPSYKGQLALKQFNPRTLMALMGNKVDFADPKALSSAKFDITFSGNSNKINASQLSGKLDDTTLKGSLAVNNIKTQAVSFDLGLDQIDLDRYRGTAGNNGKAQPQQAATATPATAAVATAQVLPVELLRSLNINGKATINKLRVAQTDITDISMTAKAKGGDIRLYPVKAKLSGGTYDGNITINVKGREPVINVNEKLANVRTGPLVQTFTGHDAISGIGNITAKVTTRGNTEASLRRNLNGTIGFAVGEGLLKEINIDHLLRSAYALKKGRPLPDDQGIKDTVFSSLSANAVINNGILSNRDLKIASDNLRINGKGKVNLINDTMKYRLTLNLIKSYQGPNSKEFDELKRLTVPLVIEGPFSNLSKNIDVGKLLTDEIKQKATDKLLESILGKQKQQPATNSQPPPTPAPQQGSSSVPTPAPQGSVPQSAPQQSAPPPPQLTPEEERRQRKEQEKRQKEKLLRDILGL